MFCLYLDLNRGRSDPKADDIPMCRDDSLILQQKTVNEIKLNIRNTLKFVLLVDTFSTDLHTNQPDMMN